MNKNDTEGLKDQNGGKNDVFNKLLSKNTIDISIEHYPHFITPTIDSVNTIVAYSY